MSVIPPRAQDALDLDPLGVFAGVPSDERANVGLRMELTLDAPGATTITDVQWTIPGAIIGGYHIASAVNVEQGFLSDCTTTDLTPSDLQQDSIAYYYTDTGDSLVSLSAVVDGVPMTDSKLFSVRRNPKAEIFYLVGPGSQVTLTDLTGDGVADIDDFLLYQATFGNDVDPAGTLGFGILGEHNAWHELVPSETEGDEFFRFHRGFIGKADCWRGIFGYPCVQVYATAPSSVPIGDEVDHFGIGSGGPCDTGVGAGDGNGIIAFERDTSNYGSIDELPARFTIAGDGTTSLVDFATGHDLVLSIITFHNSQHGNICHSGDFLRPCTTPADPIFWRFHLMLTKVYELWQFLKLDDGTMTIPTVDCTGPGGTQVFFPEPAATVLTDCGNPVVFDCDPPSGAFFPVGMTTVHCTVSDVMMLDLGFGGANLGTTQDISFVVTVVDTDPPDITLNPDIELWPPNHAYVTIDITDIIQSVDDPCEGTIDLGSARILDVSSDEVEDGQGDGSTLDDIVIAGDCRSVQLRRERAGGGNGRVYTITVEASDSSGNTRAATYHVTVPHDQGSGGAAGDDGPAYTIFCGS